MTSPEQSGSYSPELESYTPELYAYKSVLDALSSHGVPNDDIAFIGDVVERWGDTIPRWSAVTELRQMIAGFDTYSDQAEQAKKLCEQAEQLLTRDHWDRAAEAVAESNALLLRRPGQFYTNDTQAGELVVIEGVSLAGDRSQQAQLQVAGNQQHALSRLMPLKVFIDVTQLDAQERHAFAVYEAAQEISPF